MLSRAHTHTHTHTHTYTLSLTHISSQDLLYSSLPSPRWNSPAGGRNKQQQQEQQQQQQQAADSTDACFDRGSGLGLSSILGGRPLGYSTHVAECKCFVLKGAMALA